MSKVLNPLKFKLIVLWVRVFFSLFLLFFFLIFIIFFWIVSITYSLIIYLFWHFESFNIWIGLYWLTSYLTAPKPSSQKENKECVVTHTHTYILSIICRLWIFWFLSIVIAMDYSFECNLSLSYIYLLFNHIYFVLFQ